MRNASLKGGALTVAGLGHGTLHLFTITGRPVGSAPFGPGGLRVDLRDIAAEGLW